MARWWEETGGGKERREGGILGSPQVVVEVERRFAVARSNAQHSRHTHSQRLRMSSVCLSCQDVRSLWVEQGVGILEKWASPSMD
jgi:hypothetical protein